MKKKYYFDNTNVFSELNGTYRKSVNIQNFTAYNLKEKKINKTLDFDLSNKFSKTEKLSGLMRTITKFFSIKENFYTNGSKVCNSKFIFDNKF